MYAQDLFVNHREREERDREKHREDKLLHKPSLFAPTHPHIYCLSKFLLANICLVLYVVLEAKAKKQIKEDVGAEMGGENVEMGGENVEPKIDALSQTAEEVLRLIRSNKKLIPDPIRQKIHILESSILLCLEGQNKAKANPQCSLCSSLQGASRV